MNVHPSQYTIDRAALGAPLAPPDLEHLATCERCAGIVASRRAPLERPAWLDAVRVPPLRPRGRARRSWPRWSAVVPLAAAAFAVAAVLLLPVGDRDREGLDGTRAKGTPRVAVYLKRADAVVAWDGRAPVRPGDRLRLGVHGAGYSHVSVASVPPPPATPAILYAGELSPEGETLLPVGFRVDDRGAAEVMSVVVATRPIEAAEHLPLRSATAGDPVWTTCITLPKEDHR